MLDLIMRWILFLAAGSLLAQTTVIRTTILIDGKGHVLRDRDIAIEGGHATWYFNKDGRYEQGPGRGANAVTTPQQAALYAEGNMYATLMGGFTTVQSVGAMLDGDLRRIRPDQRKLGRCREDQRHRRPV
jgi:hypothetical protein